MYKWTNLVNPQICPAAASWQPDASHQQLNQITRLIHIYTLIHVNSFFFFKWHACCDQIASLLMSQIWLSQKGVGSMHFLNLLHFKEVYNLAAGARGSSRHLDNFYHQDLKVKQDADCRGGISVSPGSSGLNYLVTADCRDSSGFAVKTSSVSRRVGPALVFHSKSTASLLDGLPDSPV